MLDGVGQDGIGGGFKTGWLLGGVGAEVLVLRFPMMPIRGADDGKIAEDYVTLSAAAAKVTRLCITKSANHQRHPAVQCHF